MLVRWTTPVARDLYNIVRRIQQDNPDAAAKVAKTLHDGCGALSDFPRRGRKGRIRGTRELVFPSLPYIVVYRIQDQDLEILRIIMEPKTGPNAGLSQNAPLDRILPAIVASRAKSWHSSFAP
jgi:addiction module RelE/StbE family toxin